ncbi:hypothetical protein KIW84_021241 [Lathyrus oleraceus]|uniref:Uncharacterized protein n=1 Tax=Pisum sativum TaxID=3888 RepID=A0A9D5B551_PEA|nr:hypothetical protein KIW84_021241 [Pisum sativum]
MFLKFVVLVLTIACVQVGNVQAIPRCCKDPGDICQPLFPNNWYQSWLVLPVLEAIQRSQIRVGAMAADEGKVKIEKFDGAGFRFWKMQIEDYLYKKGMHEPLTGTEPTTMEDSAWTLLDRKALGVIRFDVIS